ncbi:MAG TPA: hypothetical protein GX690_03180 [Tenericutes bacterium]|jgi:cytochrome c oxidase subunit IV|nr:hypothetical protein [Mycoplasmatota bacterium]
MQFLVPASAKRGNLIFNMYRPIDLMFLIPGLLISVFMLMIFGQTNYALLIISVLPGALVVLLTMPLPNYHNGFVFFGNVIKHFFIKQNQFRWRGWVNDDGEENKETKK